MLRTVNVTNLANGATRDFHVADGVLSDAVKVQNISGLGPSEASVITAPYVDIDGVAYQGTIVGDRNIVFTVKLDPDYATESVETLRNELYILFQQKGVLRMTFTRDDPLDPVITIAGYVDKMPAEYFVSEVILQFSVICPSPYFVSASGAVTVDTALTDPDYIAEFDIRGTAPTPYEVRFPVVPGKTLQQVAITFRAGSDRPQQMVVFGLSLTTADYVSLQNVPGKKVFAAKASSGFTVQNILYRISNGSVWPELIPKHQSIAGFTSYTDFTFNRAFSLIYTPQFLGV